MRQRIICILHKPTEFHEQEMGIMTHEISILVLSANTNMSAVQTYEMRTKSFCVTRQRNNAENE
jgi:hypothetical protein